MKPEQWQRQRHHRRKDPGLFNLGLPENIPDDPDSDLDGPVIRRASPGRPYRCQFCKVRLAYPWTLDEHLRSRHAALLPKPHRATPAGPVVCRWCPAGYPSEAERTLHEQAFHARNLALDIGGYSSVAARGSEHPL